MCAVVPVLFADRGARLLAATWASTRGAGSFRGASTASTGSSSRPLLHDGFDHLYGNSVPLILLGTFVLAAGSAPVHLVDRCSSCWSAASACGSPARPTLVVVGASGVIFGYFGLLLARGIVERTWWNLGVVVLVGLLYWWQLFVILPSRPHVSWQGHLFGFLGGAVAAILFRR